MPTVVTDLQRKYRYKVAIVINSSETVHSNLPVDEFTPPDKRQDAVTRQNQKLGMIVLNGPPTYGEMTVRLALRVTDDAANTTAILVNDLQQMNENDADTCDVILNTLADAGGSEQVSYKQLYSNCRLTGYKIEPLNRKGDDDMLHIEMTLMPSRVSRMQGDQIPGA